MTFRYLAGTALAFVLCSGAAMAQEVRFMCSSDANECEVLNELMNRAVADQPGVKVVTDVVPYDAILKSLPVQLAAGTGPDMAHVTDLGGLNPFYLDVTPYVDAAYWEENLGDVQKWYRAGPDDKGIYGVHDMMTITGPYINRTLFDQAGVAVPGPEATWDDWAAAATQVAKATGIPYPMAIDRSGHRVAGPAISFGAQIFDADGKGLLVDDGFKAFSQKFVDWNKDGTMAREVWAGMGGDAYRDAAKEFINGQLAFYYSGSWQVRRFDKEVGDSFDWEVVGSPCGGAACSGMPGGSGTVGFKQTKHPELVGKILNYLAQEANYREFSERTSNIPAHKAVTKAGPNYSATTANAGKALAAWTTASEKISPVAYAYQGYKNNRALFNITVQRLTQAIVDEVTLDEAMTRAAADVAEALAQAQ